MKGIIILNGEPYKEKINDNNAYVICADGGYNWAHNKVRIDESIGDFDSIKNTPSSIKSQVFPVEKDQTDGELALLKMIEISKKKSIDKIEIYGGGGKREDHFIGNLNLLYLSEKKGISCEMITNTANIYIKNKDFILNQVKGKTISLFPFNGNAHILNSRGLYYPINNLLMQYGSTIGVSNIATEDLVQVKITKGFLLIIVNTEII